MRQLLHHPDTRFCRVNLTTLQCSHDATARRLACPPIRVRPGMLRPTRTCTPELSRGRSPAPRVGYDYTAPLGRDCDRTYTGWSAAVMGCALCWLIPKHSEKRSRMQCLKPTKIKEMPKDQGDASGGEHSYRAENSAMRINQQSLYWRGLGSRYRCKRQVNRSHGISVDDRDRRWSHFCQSLLTLSLYLRSHRSLPVIP